MYMIRLHLQLGSNFDSSFAESQAQVMKESIIMAAQKEVAQLRNEKRELIGIMRGYLHDVKELNSRVEAALDNFNENNQVIDLSESLTTGPPPLPVIPNIIGRPSVTSVRAPISIRPTSRHCATATSRTTASSSRTVTSTAAVRVVGAAAPRRRK
jgi:hypothetical protein